ncbi:hypothetical protein AVT65_gp76 [Gordonia phage Gmala1]|uniref:Uncharacterized protein n=1 Tax=Gordonia phage Gmala1 TaxID=1622190 RepID=A0A0E3T6N9_9CAUD|nr:hypothetical protein AVT65_gp76 [Gordonia phage Gmala1]AKC02914.1 hypothetical protein Gmala1_76 [Gordonia phage Gmala1]
MTDNSTENTESTDDLRILPSDTEKPIIQIILPNGEEHMVTVEEMLDMSCRPFYENGAQVILFSFAAVADMILMDVLEGAINVISAREYLTTRSKMMSVVTKTFTDEEWAKEIISGTLFHENMGVENLVNFCKELVSDNPNVEEIFERYVK